MRKPNMSVNQTPSATLSLQERSSSFAEVVKGYTLEEAQAEAERCLNCPDKYCMQYCPAHNYIPEFIAEIREGNLQKAWEILASTNPFMEISGRICPYEEQCESHCTRSIKCEAVAIGKLERFVADWHRENKGWKPMQIDSLKKKVAIVGAGPAGITCALSLSDAGFDVTIYEASNEIGGVAAWGIPEFVLPKHLLANFKEQISAQKIEVKYGEILGQTVQIADLSSKYDAVFVATGAQKPVASKVPGSDLTGLLQAKDYLAAPCDCKGKKVCIIGGGNTAIDAARVAIRMGAAEVSMLYRRTEKEMPVTKLELKLAKEEGVTVRTLLSPAAYLAKDGSLSSISCDIMELTAPDYPGGRNNVAASGKQEEIACDLAILALGFENVAIPGLPCDEKHRIIADKRHETPLTNVFAGGDAVTGPATFMKASAAGKEAACEIFSLYSPL